MFAGPGDHGGYRRPGAGHGRAGTGGRRAGKRPFGRQSEESRLADDRESLRRASADSGRNVIYLPWDPKAETTDIDAFRPQILLPVFDALHRRHPEGQIDYVVYSSDFPWGIDLQSDIKRFEARAWPSPPRPTARRTNRRRPRQSDGPKCSRPSGRSPA